MPKTNHSLRDVSRAQNVNKGVCMSIKKLSVKKIKAIKGGNTLICSTSKGFILINGKLQCIFVRP